MAETTQAPPATGTFCWHKLGTRDTAAAKTFFTKLMGWTSEDMNMGPGGTYTIFKHGDTQVCGMYAMEGPQFENVPPHWMSYIAVDDVDVMTSKAQSLGAQVCKEATDIPNIGRFSVIQDPTGAVVAFFQKSDCATCD